MISKQYWVSVGPGSVGPRKPETEQHCFKSFPKCVKPTTHPRVFVRFGKTKGEIWVKKGNFRGNLGGFWGVLTLFGNQPPHPPTFGRDLPKKNGFFLAASLIIIAMYWPVLVTPPSLSLQKDSNQCVSFCRPCQHVPVVRVEKSLVFNIVDIFTMYHYLWKSWGCWMALRSNSLLNGQCLVCKRKFVMKSVRMVLTFNTWLILFKAFMVRFVKGE